jgi:hypothetical protein
MITLWKRTAAKKYAWRLQIAETRKAHLAALAEKAANSKICYCTNCGSNNETDLYRDLMNSYVFCRLCRKTTRHVGTYDEYQADLAQWKATK